MPPFVRVTAMRAKVYDIADCLRFLPERCLKLWFIDQNFARPVLFEQPAGGFAVLAPAPMAQLDHLWVVVKPSKCFLQVLKILWAIMKTCRILQKEGAQLA